MLQLISTESRIPARSLRKSLKMPNFFKESHEVGEGLMHQECRHHAPRGATCPSPGPGERRPLRLPRSRASPDAPNQSHARPCAEPWACGQEPSAPCLFMDRLGTVYFPARVSSACCFSPSPLRRLYTFVTRAQISPTRTMPRNVVRQQNSRTGPAFGLAFAPNRPVKSGGYDANLGEHSPSQNLELKNACQQLATMSRTYLAGRDGRTQASCKGIAAFKVTCGKSATTYR